jgi:hypothetical protein
MPYLVGRKTLSARCLDIGSLDRRDLPSKEAPCSIVSDLWLRRDSGIADDDALGVNGSVRLAVFFSASLLANSFWAFARAPFSVSPYRVPSRFPTLARLPTVQALVIFRLLTTPNRVAFPQEPQACRRAGMRSPPA